MTRNAGFVVTCNKACSSKSIELEVIIKLDWGVCRSEAPLFLEHHSDLTA
jgi:hypothetical protein